MSNVPTSITMAEILTWAEGSLMRDHRERIQGAIRRLLANWASDFVASSVHNGEVDGRRDASQLLCLLTHFVFSVQEDLRHGSRLWQHRCMEPSTVFDFLKCQKELVAGIKQLMICAVRELCIRHMAPARRAMLSEDESLLPALTDAERKAILADLAHGLIPQQLVESVYAMLLCRPGAFLEPYCVFLAFDLRDGLGSLDHLFQPSDEAVATVADLFSGKANEEDLTRAFRNMVTARRPLPANVPSNTRIDRLLITSARSWESACSQVEEHFGIALRQGLAEKWESFRGQSEYVLVFEEALPFNNVQPAVEYWLRQFIALTRCYRRYDATKVLADVGIGQFVATSATPAQCRMLAVPLGPPCSVQSTAKEAEVERLVPITSSFPVAAFPFICAGDLAKMAKEIERPWQWLRSDTADACLKMHRALECFETANSIGGGCGVISADLEEAWAIVGLTTTLEVAFCADCQDHDRRKTVMQQLRPILQRTQRNHDARHREKVLGRVWNQRNNCVHKGKAQLAPEALADVRATVALALRAAIEQAMPAVPPRRP